MRFFTPLAIIFCALCFAPTCNAEDAAEFREKGIAALKDSQQHPRAIVEAARAFVKASELYVTAGDEEKAIEMNSFLYWCKKKMAMEDIDAFVKEGDAAVSNKLNAIEKLAPKADEAQAYLDRAELFANKNPAEHLLIAIRFYEVADRFKGSDASMKAQDRSLKEQLQDKSTGSKSVLPPTAIRVPDTAPATVGSRPIPPADDIKQAEKLVRDLLKEDYAKTDGPGRLALATKLLQQADENKGDPASEYVLLHEARDSAVAGGDATLATDAQKRLRDGYKIDFAAMLIDLRKLEAISKSPDAATALATLLLLGSADALNVDNYEQAVRYNSRAEDLLPLIKNVAFKEHLKIEVAHVLALKQASTAALAANKILATKPDDPEANLTAGKFALQKGEFEKAFALLAKGSDKTLAGISKRELTPAAEAPEQAKLGDDWFDLAAKESNTFVKKAMQERAGVWYGNALPALSGLAKLKIETRMKGLAKTPDGVNKRETATGGRAINLLSLVDLAKDSVEGHWVLRQGALTSDNAEHGRIELPYHPPEEYDFRLVFTRVEGDNCMNLIMSHSERQFMFTIAGWYNKYSGLELIDGVSTQDSPLKSNTGLKNNQKYTAVVQVRKDRLTAFLDGKIISEVKTDYTNVSIFPDWKLRQSDILGIAHYQGKFIVYSAELLEVTGSGKPSR